MLSKPSEIDLTFRVYHDVASLSSAYDLALAAVGPGGRILNMTEALDHWIREPEARSCMRTTRSMEYRGRTGSGNKVLAISHEVNLPGRGDGRVDESDFLSLLSGRLGEVSVFDARDEHGDRVIEARLGAPGMFDRIERYVLHAFGEKSKFDAGLTWNGAWDQDHRGGAEARHLSFEAINFGLYHHFHLGHHLFEAEIVATNSDRPKTPLTLIKAESAFAVGPVKSAAGAAPNNRPMQLEYRNGELVVFHVVYFNMFAQTWPFAPVRNVRRIDPPGGGKELPMGLSPFMEYQIKEMKPHWANAYIQEGRQIRFAKVDIDHRRAFLQPGDIVPANAHSVALAAARGALSGAAS